MILNITYTSPMHQDWQNNYFNWIYKTLSIKNKIKTYEVDFEKPWYDLVLKRKWILGLTVLSETAQSSFANLIPIWLVIAFTQNKYHYIIWIISIYLILELCNRVILFYFTVANNSLGSSYFNSAYKYFLTVDPIYHSTKSSGKIVSKITNSWFDFMNLTDSFIFSILPSISAFGTSAIALITVDRSLAIFTIPSFFIITGISIAGFFYNSIIFKQKIIKVREKAASTATENLIQNNLIRATFATQNQLQKYEGQLKNFFSIRSTSRISSGFVVTITRTCVMFSVALIAWRLFIIMNSAGLEPELAGSLLVTYYLGTQSILRIGRVVYTAIDSYQGIQDMWEYIRKFGKQTYPVVDSDTL